MLESLVDIAKLKELPNFVIPEPFERAPSTYSLEELVEGSYWTQAVKKTTTLLAEYHGRDEIKLENVPSILRIWYWRFYSLLKLRLGSQVNDETLACLAALDDPDVKDLDDPLIWDLRLMLIPVRAKGINQTAIQQMYAMAAEARIHLGGQDDEIWQARLRKLGLHVVAALLGMRDPSTAIDLLESLYYGEKDLNSEYAESLAKTLTLVFLHIGNLAKARQWTKESFAKEVEAIESMATSYTAATKQDNVHASIAKGMEALHKGDIPTARNHFELHLKDLSLSGLYNLFVVYDLNPGTSAENKKKAAKSLIDDGRTSLGTYELFL